MKYLLTALAVTIAALALAVGAFGTSGQIAQIEHATLHLEQTGNKPFMLERADLRIRHATQHWEQIGMKYWVGS